MSKTSRAAETMIWLRPAHPPAIATKGLAARAPARSRGAARERDGRQRPRAPGSASPAEPSSRRPCSSRRGTVRITARVTPEERARIAMGTVLAGQSLSAFLRTAALEHAERVIAQHDLPAKIDAHLATATRHPAGTTDHLLAPDRERPYSGHARVRICAPARSRSVAREARCPPHGTTVEPRRPSERQNPRDLQGFCAIGANGSTSRDSGNFSRLQSTCNRDSALDPGEVSSPSRPESPT